MATSSDSTDPLEDILDEAIDKTDGGCASVQDILDSFGSQSLGPVILLAGMIVIIPVIGAIPGVPSIVGLSVFLFSVQFLVGKRSIWLPEAIRTASIERQKLKTAQEKAAPFLRWADTLFTERLTFMSSSVMERVSAGVVTALAAAMIPMELIPGAVAVPGWAMIFFGVGLMARDGLMLILAFLASLGTVYLIASVLL
ncbi:putative exoD-like membrane protein [Parvularcula bermudensis HTCC2503]|uniref:Putative exoD-like membrane protein n=1 Tax=Parvularcula bermudensis (strain ATCC BAA-594 / HTCC2503 / KCTC 12087) TaxID=314260 RepID=E0TCF1_PARBH|nr:exopolysaccharide biosynthesis protein [Parvularcula bermudensis]ADM09841.1 putative exoD-like membrane protein [Parvularcula bermudensis HTCC2503]